ncbi:hypothetical protein D3C81_983560 [compost metagenome]
MFTGGRPNIHQPVGAAHGVEVVLHHINRVAGLFQALQGFEQGFAVGRMQAGRGLVEHIDHAEQL